MDKSKETEILRRELYIKLEGLEQKQELCQIQKKRIEKDEELYYDIRKRIIELLDAVSQHWQEKNNRIHELEEDDMYSHFCCVEDQLGEKKEQMEKEYIQLCREEASVRGQLQRLR